MLAALEKTLGVVTKACKVMDLNRSTFYNWYNSDKVFAAQVDSIGDIAIDFVESKLFEQIDEGNVTASIFYLKTKGKKRGYIERIENDVTLNGKLNIAPIDWID